MILLSFDIEEFDVPKEHQVDISMEEQIKVSVEGTNRILDCLERNQVKATFFCTAIFALHAPDIIKRIQEGGHEIASHGFYHWTFKVEDLKRSKDQLEEITGTKVYGYRQARMMPVSEKAVYEDIYPGKIYAALYSSYSFYKRPCDANAGISNSVVTLSFILAFMS